MISLDEAKGIMANSLDSFLDKHENINLLQVEAECINNACLYYLNAKNEAYSGLRRLSPYNPFDSVSPSEVGETFGMATKAIIPQFSQSMISNASLATLQNTQWEGMWDFLERYFAKTHNIDINN